MVKFKYYKTAATYGTAGDSIAKDDIVFIEETNTLHTHEHDYVFGNAYTDMWLKQAALGSSTKPVYLSAKGEFSEASTYAGGTAVTLNGTSKAASTASFYAPTSAGTSGQIIKFPSSGSTPVWSSDYVASVGGKSGAITLDTTTTTAKAVKFAIDSTGKITGSVQGLGTSATTDASAYATSAQGTTADSALQSVSIAGTSLTKSSNSISAATLKANLGLGSAAYTESTNYATSTQGATADSAIQSVSIAGHTLTKSSNTLSLATLKSDLGITSAMNFVGTTTTALTDGATTATLAGTGLSKTTGFVAGDVVLYGDKEFVYNGSKWEIFGDEGSYALKTVKVEGTGALTGGGAISSNQTIDMVNLNVAGSAGPTANVSGTSSIDVPRITIDKYGRVTALSSKTYTGVDTWKAANTTQEGYVPKLTAASVDTIATQASEYVLTYKSGTDTTPVWRKLPANAYLNNTYTVNDGTLTIKGNNTSAATFTANQSGASNLNIVGSGTAASGTIVTSVSATSGTITVSAQMEWAEYN